MTFARGLPVLLALITLSWPLAAAAQQAPPEPAPAQSETVPTISQALVGAINDAGITVSTSLAREIEGAERVVEDIAGKAVLYLALAIGAGLAIGMILGALLSSLVLRGTISRALAAAR